MNTLIIDNKEVSLDEKDRTLVDTIRRCKKSITAPCYKTLREFGACNSCLIEVDGEKKLACGNSPSEGLNIILNTPPLVVERKKKVQAFKKHKELMSKLMKKY